LWDRYGGSIPSGWTRWVLEQFEFPFETVFAPRLDAGNLRDQFDVLIFVTGAFLPASGATNPPPAGIPAEWRDRWGGVSVQRTAPALRTFLEAGGVMLTIGSSTDLAKHFDLPLTSHLVTTNDHGKEIPLPRAQHYIPGSLVRVRVNPEHPLAWGAEEWMVVMLRSSPVFRSTEIFTPVAWFDEPAPLRSGWALGQEWLQNGIAIAEARVGAGRLVLFGPEIVFRAQSHGTFKFLFNGILNAGTVQPSIPAFSGTYQTSHPTTPD